MRGAFRWRSVGVGCGEQAFIHCVLSETAASRDHFVRHRCHDRSCINPEHLELGSAADNKHGDWAHWAYGTDPDYL